MSMETEQGPTDDLHLEAANAMMGLLNGSWAARLVHAAAELGIADHLVDQARNAAFLASATQAHAPSLARLLRALTAIGVLNETDDRRYSLTQLGTTLRSDVPGSMRAWALLFFSDDQGKAWEALPPCHPHRGACFPPYFRRRSVDTSRCAAGRRQAV
jgi:hypothetical protein